MKRQFLTGEEGHKVAGVIPMRDYEELLEDVAELAAVAERWDQERISLDDLKMELISEVEAARAVLIRHGGRSDIYHNPMTGATQLIPRHGEINELLARMILSGLTRREGG